MAIDRDSILAVIKNIGESLHVHLAVLIPQDEQMRIAAIGSGLTIDEKELAVADWAFP